MKAKALSVWRNKLARSKPMSAAVFALVFGIVGAGYILMSQAATPVANFEAENGSLTGNASRSTDTSASGGSAVKFAAGTTTPPPTDTITHGEQLTEANVGPWVLQGVPKGQEQLEKISAPSRGYWRFDTPSEFVPNGSYTYNNNPNNHGGTLAADTMIDGYLIPAGTKVIQFRDLSAADFYAQGASGTWLFRGIKSRQSGVGGASLFNDYTASYTNYVHYSDIGGLGPNNGQEMLVAWKMLGGKDHRVYRTHISNVTSGLQPNVVGVEITENLINGINFYYGEPGPCGTGGSCTYHLNGISSEGMSNTTPTRFKILRNNITLASPDGAGRVVTQTDAIGLFGTNGGSYNDVLVEANYLGGGGYTVYAAGERPGAKNVRFINNKFTSRWWTNSGNFGSVASPTDFGSNGNVATGNVWADDYGSGGNGNTPTSSRQYPSGNGPRKGQAVFGN